MINEPENVIKNPNMTGKHSMYQALLMITFNLVALTFNLLLMTHLGDYTVKNDSLKLPKNWG